MREFDKMISGQMYNALDAELVEMRLNVRRLLTQMNQSAEDTPSGVVVAGNQARVL